MAACIHFTKAGVLLFGQHIFKCGLNHFAVSFPTRKADNGPTRCWKGFGAISSCGCKVRRSPQSGGTPECY